jgi:site-specific recombinase XerD
MEKSFGLFFYLKKTKGYIKGDIPIYLGLTANRTSTEISTKRKCDPEIWISSAGRVKGKTEFAKSLNTYLDLLQQKVYDARNKLLENNHRLTAENMKTLLFDKEIHQQKHMLLEIFKLHNDQITALVGSDYALGTLERYNTAFKHTKPFLQSKYNINDIDIANLDYEFITEYEFWLKSVRKCDHNTTIKYLSNFRKIINQCIRKGWLQRDAFIGFKMTKKEVERTALTELEIQKLITQQFSVDRIVQVRDIFLFSCFTGLAYIDVKKLKRSEIIVGVDGEKWLVSRRQKTAVSARIPLLPSALKIMDRYTNHAQCIMKDRLLPVLSNQKMNAYLKEIADLCGINQNLTYHIARHTFATTVTLSNGVPIETVSKMLGHRNLKTTQHYARVLDKKISDDMQKIKEKFSSIESSIY